MPKITILPPTLVNRIAAGECVERPASVLKELIENAIDAGAARIDVTIADGGRGLIQVVDDGQGMSPDDLRLCVQPHATSKIRDDEDLFHIHTMGFRGEALPSIGSVARLKITSRPRPGPAAGDAADGATPTAGAPAAAHDIAHTIRVDAGVVSRIEPVSAPPGTTVEARDLFYNVPARRKFLKTNQTESGHITEQFARLALAHPEIHFTLRSDRRTTHTLPATDDRLQRIRDFYGPQIADALLPVRRAGSGILVEGFAAPPAESRGAAKWEYTFVNHRYVRDKFVSHAIKSAYRSLIDPSRFPVTFLFITIDPAQIDVNVHPSKIEVRWRDSNYVHSQVLAALRDRFLTTNLDHALSTAGADSDEYRERVRQAMVGFFSRAGGGQRGAERAIEDRRSGIGSRVDDRPARGPLTDDLRVAASHDGSLAAPAPVEPSARNTQAAPTSDRHPAAPPLPAISDPRSPIPDPRSPIPDPRAPIPGLRAPIPDNAGPQRAMQIHNMYIVAETADGLMIVDQHALHERILYEQYKARIADRTLESQRLLLPDVVNVAPDRIEALEAHAGLLARLGLELTPAGPQSVALHAFPTFLERLDRPRFVRDLLDALCEAGARPDAEMLLHQLIDMMACKAAVKFGDPLTPAEIEALLARRTTAERSSHCPHGRPTTLRLTLRDLERQFKRR